MTEDEISNLWYLAKIIHEAKRDICWGKNSNKWPWPSSSRNYTHNPIAYVDLALACAESVKNNFDIDLNFHKI